MKQTWLMKIHFLVRTEENYKKVSIMVTFLEAENETQNLQIRSRSLSCYIVFYYSFGRLVGFEIIVGWLQSYSSGKQRSRFFLVLWGQMLWCTAGYYVQFHLTLFHYSLRYNLHIHLQKWWNNQYLHTLNKILFYLNNDHWFCVKFLKNM